MATVANLPTETIRNIEDRLLDALLDGRIDTDEYNDAMLELNGEEMVEYLRCP